jgi:hypothetical protein
MTQPGKPGLRLTDRRSRKGPARAQMTTRTAESRRTHRRRTPSSQPPRLRPQMWSTRASRPTVDVALEATSGVKAPGIASVDPADQGSLIVDDAAERDGDHLQRHGCPPGLLTFGERPPVLPHRSGGCHPGITPDALPVPPGKGSTALTASLPTTIERSLPDAMDGCSVVAWSAPRGAWLYPRRSREELGGRFLGPMAYLDPKGEGNNSMPGKQRSCLGV